MIRAEIEQGFWSLHKRRTVATTERGVANSWRTLSEVRVHHTAVRRSKRRGGAAYSTAEREPKNDGDFRTSGFDRLPFVMG